MTTRSLVEFVGPTILTYLGGAPAEAQGMVAPVAIDMPTEVRRSSGERSRIRRPPPPRIPRTLGSVVVAELTENERFRTNLALYVGDYTTKCPSLSCMPLSSAAVGFEIGVGRRIKIFFGPMLSSTSNPRIFGRSRSSLENTNRATSDRATGLIFGAMIGIRF